MDSKQSKKFREKNKERRGSIAIDSSDDENQSISRILTKRKNNFIKGLSKQGTKKFFSRGEADPQKNEIKKIIPLNEIYDHKVIHKVGENLLTYANMRNSDFIYFNKMQYIFKTKLYSIAHK